MVVLDEALVGFYVDRECLYKIYIQWFRFFNLVLIQNSWVGKQKFLIKIHNVIKLDYLTG